VVVFGYNPFMLHRGEPRTHRRADRAYDVALRGGPTLRLSFDEGVFAVARRQRAGGLRDLHRPDRVPAVLPAD